MSTCPSKDIHSVYLDNELPLAYIKEYETHVQSCPKCSTELQKLKSLKNILRNDAASITPDSHYLDSSFNRLQIRMNYSKHTKFSARPNISAGFKYAIPAMAAAAVMALVLPVSMKKNTPAPANAQLAEISVPTPLTVNSAPFDGTKNVVVSGNIPKDVVQTIGRPVSSSKIKQNFIQDVDVFRPNFDNENTISIKITVPGINAVPVTTEIDFPADLVTGYFK